jgi:sugar lactone lactonase YvrE
MPHGRRVGSLVGLAIVATLAASGARSFGQENREVNPVEAALIKKSLPNPYQTVEGWAKLPDGRKWGAPSKVFVDPDGKSLWVAERCGGDSFGCAGSTLAPLLEFDMSGKLVKSFGQGMFVFPHGLAVDKDGNVWSTDGNGRDGKGHQVFKFSPDGKLLLTLGKAGVAGAGPDTFNQPADVAIASNGDIFVSDGHQGCNCDSRIVKFSKNGTFIKAWGQKGSGPGDLIDPHCLSVDSKGRLFVCDRRNDRIQIFDQDGHYVDAWKQFGRPSGMFITKDDTLYVAEQELGIIIGSAKDGSITAYVPTPIPAPGQRRRGAESVAVDAAGNLYTGEIGSMKLMKYVRK